MPSSTSSSPACTVSRFTSPHTDSHFSDDYSKSDLEPLLHTRKRKREDENLQTISKSRFRSLTSSTILDTGSLDGERSSKDFSGLSDDRLCPACSAINFESIFQSAKDITTKHGIPVSELGDRLDDAKVHTSGCDLCRLLCESRFPGHYRQYHLRAYSSLRSYHISFFSSKSGSFGNNDSVFLAVVPGKTVPSVNTSKIESHCWGKGYLCLATPIQEPARYFSGQEVPKQVDYRLLDSWYQYCLRNHTDCRRNESNAIPGLKVIDCEKGTIEHASTNDVYVALSYVWGCAKAPQTNGDVSRLEHSNTCDELATLPDYLPNVVTDAITVTKSLGFRYLWIDRYCIDQGNFKEKHDQISKMDLIYRGAEITIVAAAGVDEEFGLPGVGNRIRSPQPAVRVRGKVLVSSLGHPMHAINASKWSTRGWTYQEAVLSRRRLVFTEHQVYFECTVMNCYESSHHAMDFLHTKDRSTKRSFMHPGMFAGIDLSKDKDSKKYARNAYLKFLTHLMNFTSRNLTYESDALNAFSGIAQSFQNVQFSPTPIHHLWGLPLEFPSPDVNRQIQRLSLMNSLTWFHEVADGAPVPQRRHGFPSWSWSGWKGKVVIQRLFDEDWRLFSGGHSNSGLRKFLSS